MKEVKFILYTLHIIFITYFLCLFSMIGFDKDNGWHVGGELFTVLSFLLYLVLSIIYCIDYWNDK